MTLFSFLWCQFSYGYKYVATDLTWADAEIHCVGEGANLVSIHSLEEQNLVKFLIKNFDPAEGQTWIGLSDIHKEGAWLWSDGSSANFFFWHRGEPNNVEGRKHCVHTNFDPKLRWNDIPCSHKLHFVCASRTICP
ncbi:lactose-binding lectin l-2-like [Anarrhichthys ocellatus]|uniref:lactose-binding lectin l-2-like n=1 Tax=Anarrhichthys ocellatus TaxID=433405 RepID=UPI0012ED48C8|nr:lactose-binding lectin l-2-like [Anarrhichthys ocellatus]